MLLAVSLLLAFVSIERSAQPPVTLAATSVSISAGNGHTCAVKSDSSLACWGVNFMGKPRRLWAVSARSARAGFIPVG